MNSLRIALISTPFVAVPPRAYGGTELVVHELAEGLRAQGHEVTLFATGDSQTTAELRFLYERAEWPPEPLVELNHVSWAMQEISEGSFDLIHAHSALALGMSRVVKTPPMVYTIHHVRTPELSAFYRHFPDHHYIAVSESQRRQEEPLSNCEVIHHGLNTARYGPVESPEDYVCFVARLSRLKGPEVAIDAAMKAGVPIRIGGEAHHEDQDFFQEELKCRLELPHVTWLGAVGSPDKENLLRKARALLFPINWEEPFGLAMIEGMLAGVPVVAFRAGSVPEIVEDGITGFVVRDVDEMAEVIRPGGVLESFDRNACRARAVERFSRERLVDDHLRYYRRILEEAKT
jgi:glycosyltransferase involved in cell wall biosynthesis